MSDILYTTEAISTGGGRDGHVDVPSAGLGFEMRAPKELGGPGEGVNPEQLFAAGYAACFHSALLGARSSRSRVRASEPA